MADKQANLAENFPKFIDVLRSIPGGLPNVHIGVVTSDMGTQGPPPSTGPSIGGGAAGTCTDRGKDGALQTFAQPVTGLFLSALPTPGFVGQCVHQLPDSLPSSILHSEFAPFQKLFPHSDCR